MTTPRPNGKEQTPADEIQAPTITDHRGPEDDQSTQTNMMQKVQRWGKCGVRKSYHLRHRESRVQKTS